MIDSTSFIFYGHPNVLSQHKNTIEFTREEHLTKKGDCILGVNADFNLSEIKEITSNFSEIEIIIRCGDMEEKIRAKVNKNFNHDGEIVIRKSDFLSERTLGINADRVAIDIDRKMVDKLKDSEAKGKVIIKGIE